MLMNEGGFYVRVVTLQTASNGLEITRIEWPHDMLRLHYGLCTPSENTTPNRAVRIWRFSRHKYALFLP